jgi:hypothetical protein
MGGGLALSGIFDPRRKRSEGGSGEAIYASVPDEIIICSKKWEIARYRGLRLGLKVVLLWEAELRH